MKSSLALCAAVCGLQAFCAAPRTISINFGSDSGAVTGEYGIVPSSSWNNFSENVCSDGKEVAVSDGTAGVKAYWWSHNNFSYTNDVTDAALKGYLDDGACGDGQTSDGAHIGITGIPFDYYDVVIYYATDNANRSFNPAAVSEYTVQTSCGANAYSYDGLMLAARNATSLKFGASRSATAVIGTNVSYLRKGFSYRSLDIKGGSNSNSARGGIAAVQLIERTDVVPSLSINFNSVTGLVSGAYGVVPSTNWVNTTEASATDIAIASSDGSGTAKASYSSKNTWSYAGANIDKVLCGYLDDGDSLENAISVSVTNIPYAYYDVIVYQATDNASKKFNPPSVNGVYYSYDGTKTSSTRNDASLAYGASQKCCAGVGANVVYLKKGFAGDLTIKGAGNANSARGCIAGVQVLDVTDLVEVLEDGAVKEISEVPTEAVRLASAGNITIRWTGAAGVAAADLVPLVSTVSVKGRVTWEGFANDALESSADGSTYSAGAGSATSPVAIAHNGGSITLTGMTPYYLKQSCNDTDTTVTMTDATVIYTTCMGIGQATYTVDGSTRITTGKNSDSYQSFVLSQGADKRNATFILKDSAEITVSQSNDDDSNQNAVIFGHWAGNSTFTIQDEAKFTAPGQVLIGRTGGDHTINIKGGTFTTEGFKLSSRASGTNTMNLVGGTLNLGANGITSYSTSRTMAVNVNGDAEIRATATSLPISQAITVAAGRTLTIDGDYKAEVSLTGTITKGDGAAVVVKNAIVDVASGCDAGTAVSADVTYRDTEIRFHQTREACGKGTRLDFTNIPAGTTAKLVLSDGSEVALDVNAGAASYQGEMQVGGAATLFDVTFANNKADIGKKEDGTFTYKAVSASLQWDNAASFTKGSGETWDDTVGCYIRSHPYIGRAYGTFAALGDFTAVVVGQMSPSDNTIFIHLGSSYWATSRGVLITTTGVKNQVLIAINTNGTVDADNGVKATVPNAASTRHAYVLVRQNGKLAVYVDGTLRGSITLPDGFTMGTSGNAGIQVGSDFGGEIRKANVYHAVSDESAETGYVNVIRVYDYVLSDAQVKAINDQYASTDTGDVFTRTIGENGALKATDAWTNKVTQTALDFPASEAGTPSAELTVSAESTLTLNAALELNDLAIGGDGTLTLALDPDYPAEHVVTVADRATINCPVVLPYGAIALAGTPIELGDGGALTFDLSSLDVSVMTKTGYVTLTGLMTRNDEKVTITGTPRGAYRSVTLEYREGGYSLKVTPLCEVSFTVTPGANSTAAVKINGESVETIPTTITEDYTYEVTFTAIEDYAFEADAQTVFTGTAGTEGITIAGPDAKATEEGPSVNPGEGEIEKPTEAGGNYVVKPAEGKTEITVNNLPAGAKVEIPSSVIRITGVAAGNLIVKNGIYDITAALDISTSTKDGVTTIGDVIRKVADDTITEASAKTLASTDKNATIATVPGLYYQVLGDTDVGFAATKTGDKTQATGESTTLSKPDLGTSDKAFFKVRVTK